MSDTQLVKLALEARENAYAPYSEFFVGAALLDEDGEVFLGANVENASYSLTLCAERTALFAAVAKGKRRFAKIAIVGGKKGEINRFCPPCGACRQALSEFSKDGKLEIVLFDGKTQKTITLADALPMGFDI